MPPIYPGAPGDGYDDEGDRIENPDEFRPPLPPEDRIWRHPSEVAAFGAPGAGAVAPDPSGRDRASGWGPSILAQLPRRGILAVAAVSALIGATGSIGLLAASGRLTEATVVVEREVAVQPMPDASADGMVTIIADRISPSIASVSVTRGADLVASNAVVFRSDGKLLAPAHMVTDADRIVVTIDGRSDDATLVGVDPVTDIAVLSIPRTGLDPADLGSAHHLGAGDWMLAVGSDGSMPVLTAGYVASRGGRAVLPDGTSLHDMLLLDTAVAKSTVGCALTDEHGAVVGMASMAAFDRDGTSDDAIAVVTPIDVAVAVGDELIETGRAVHTWLGVAGSDLASELSAELGIPGGATVAQVTAGSPAAIGGIRAGDIVTHIDDTAVASMSALVTALRSHRVGDAVRIGLHRDGQDTDVTVVLAERPDDD